jgi:TRAP-type C4-dicarboxylate transport system permease small subunit
VLNWLERNIEKVFITALTGVILVALFLQVVFRFVIDMPLGWTEELSVLLLPWLCYFGSSLAVRERKHLRIEILTHFLSPWWQKLFDLISNLCFLAFAIFASYYTILLTKTILDRNVMTAVLQWPKWIMYAGIPFAFLLTCYRLVKDIRRNLQELKDIANGEENSQGDLNPGLGDI